MDQDVEAEHKRRSQFRIMRGLNPVPSNGLTKMYLSNRSHKGMSNERIKNKTDPGIDCEKNSGIGSIATLFSVGGLDYRSIAGVGTH